MKKILISLSIIAAVSAVVVGATTAYFSDTETSSGNTFTAGTLKINIDQNMQTISPVISNWAPGQTTTVRFNVDNTGSLPIHLRGYAVGSWHDTSLDNAKVKVTKVEYYRESDSNWVVMEEDANGITDYFYYSPNGSDSSLWELAGGATEQFRITALFDPSADNAYQGKTYTATLTAEAKQTNAPSW